ncbi:MAG: crotonase/enoyl-CoA hydratase family protein [Acidimicrobiales bacterium]
MISVCRDGHVAVLWLDRAQRRNAMNRLLFEQLRTAMELLSDDEETRAVVIAAKGTAFSVGLDLRELGADRAGAGETISGAARARRTLDMVSVLQGAIGSVAACTKPVIAAVQGYCVGGGLDLISACDIRVCSSDATFSLREARMAMVADLGSLQRLPLIVGMGQLAELAYTAKDIDAPRAEQIGLVNAVFPDAKATLEGALLMARQIAANSPLSVQGTKAMLREVRRGEVEAGLRYVAAWNAGQLWSSDLEEALSAFLERRPPSFSGD